MAVKTLGRPAALGMIFLLLAQLQASQPSIWIDNVNGAPTPNASGSPEEMSPVTAAATCHTNGAASTTIQWPAHGIVLPSGNNCNTGDNNCGILFLGTGSGRQFTEILAVPNNDTLTVEDSFNIAAVSAVDCAVGGRLSNVETRLTLDLKGNHDSGTHNVAAGGWQIFVVNTGVNYTWTASRLQPAAAVVGSGFYGVKDGAERPTIDCNFQPGPCLQIRGSDVVGIEFRNTSGVKTGTSGLEIEENSTVRDTILGGASAATAFATGIDFDAGAPRIVGSLIRNNEVGIGITGIQTTVLIVLASVFEANGDGILSHLTGTQTPSLQLIGNVFVGHSTTAITLGHANNVYQGYFALLSNTFHDNATAVLITIQEAVWNLLFASNLITSNTVGVSYTGAAVNLERETALVDFNCYGLGPVANGSDISGFIKGPNTISVNPGYRNAATGDFTPTSQDVTFIAWPPGLDGLTPRFFPGTATISQPRCGAVQPGASGAFSNVGL
jgi:hypothetical protein